MRMKLFKLHCMFTDIGALQLEWEVNSFSMVKVSSVCIQTGSTTSGERDIIITASRYG